MASIAAITGFVNYAVRFEQALAQGDWSLVVPSFHPDALYEVGGGPPLAARYEGRDAILAHYARSTAAFDRRFDERDLALVEGPLLQDGRVWVRWAGAYRVAGAPDLPLDGELCALIEDGAIVHFEERFAEGTWARVGAWLREHGAKLRAPAAASPS